MFWPLTVLKAARATDESLIRFEVKATMLTMSSQDVSRIMVNIESDTHYYLSSQHHRVYSTSLRHAMPWRSMMWLQYQHRPFSSFSAILD